MDRDGAGLSAFTLKIIAIVGMTLCHVGVVFGVLIPPLPRALLVGCGGVTYPIMAFLVTEGYRHTSDVRRYMARLLVFALVSQIPYSLVFEPLSLDLGSTTVTLPFTGNVLFTLAIGLGLLWLYDSTRNRAVFWAIAAAGVVGSAVCDWGVIGVVMILMAHILPDGLQRRVIPALLPVVALGVPAAVSLAAGDLSALPDVLYGLAGGAAACVAIAAYTGRRGPRFKWLFYIYYPAHLLILWALSLYIAA